MSFRYPVDDDLMQWNVRNSPSLDEIATTAAHAIHRSIEAAFDGCDVQNIFCNRRAHFILIVS